ncbi:group III truncated hemoglobin [Deminuibacter soli]|uniref:Group III truncated hemoglobin n=1 Tax=Deminuibacter soli TaxID=2291815 RepID=A0A3E1NE49_9BACT|nr:group III truncated hemoglobin [Deminuibacter soli]RFM26249.1 group III truncated hemoglobin [Deminuibacter soli]
MKRDIETRADIHRIVTEFYQKMLADERVAFLFTDVARIDVPEHVEKVTGFWNDVLFAAGDYHGNPMQVHWLLNGQSPLQHTHFDLWLQYFTQTIAALFEGDNAARMQQRALSIATMMRVKMLTQPLNKQDNTAR